MQRLFTRMRLVAAALSIILAAGMLPSNITARAKQHASAGTAFTIGLLGLPSSLDPLLNGTLAAADITDAVFDSLLRSDVHDALQPDLAAKYTISPDGLRYSFQLDARARWQDGIAVTAGDVLFTARLMRDTHFPAYNRFGFGQIKSIASVGTLDVEVTLRQPYAPFLRAFATTPILPAHVLSPIPVNQIATYQAFNRRPVGSGPYQVVEYVDGNHVTVSANASYFRGAPHLDTVRFQVFPSAAAALQSIQSGGVDMLGPSIGLAPAQLLSALQSGRLNAFATPGFGWAHIDLIESGFLRDRTVRQSLAYATPRQSIVATIFKGLVTQADADQPPTSIYYEPSVAGSYPYDPARTATLLKGRGFRRVGGTYTKDGSPLRITLWYDASCGDCAPVAAQVARSWSAAGIPTVLRAVGTHALFGATGPLYSPTRLHSTQLNAVMYSWVTLPEPDDSAYWATSMIVRPGMQNGLNFVGYSNPQVDLLTQRALDTANEAKRIYDYQTVQHLLMVDQPAIFLYWLPHLSIAVDTLHGYQANPFFAGLTWNVADWSLAH